MVSKKYSEMTFGYLIIRSCLEGGLEGFFGLIRAKKLLIEAGTYSVGIQGQKMPIAVYSGLNRGMPKLALNELHILTLRNKACRVGMPEVMKADLP